MMVSQVSDNIQQNISSLVNDKCCCLVVDTPIVLRAIDKEYPSQLLYSRLHRARACSRPI